MATEGGAVRWCRIGYAIRVHALDRMYKPESPRFHGEGEAFCGKVGMVRGATRLDVPRCEDCEGEIGRRLGGSAMR